MASRAARASLDSMSTGGAGSDSLAGLAERGSPSAFSIGFCTPVSSSVEVAPELRSSAVEAADPSSTPSVGTR